MPLRWKTEWIKVAKNSRVNYSKLVPQESFLGDFLAYMSPLETPYAYDFWTGCNALSNAVGRTIVVDRPLAPVYLNLFCILVAESGVTRKSTAVRMGSRFVRELCGTNPMLVETKTTPEKLEEILHKQSEADGHSAVAIAISELVTFLGREKYVSTMPTLLTDLYDCPEVRTGGGSLSVGSRDLKNVFVSFLSASTPSWLVRAVNPDVIEGGFTSRVMFICAENPKRRQSWPEAVDKKLEYQISEHLKRIRDRAREVQRITISEGARRTFDRWYKSRVLHRDPFRASFQSREDAHILRLAAFLCINDDTWVIQHTHVSQAIRIITEVREDGASIFEGTGGSSKLVAGIDKLRDKLLAAGLSGLPQRELTQAVASYMDAEHMTAVLNIMHELQMVQKFEGIQVSRGRPKTIWRGTSGLASSKAIDHILEKHSPGR
jgi:hypothetical protein